MAAGPIVQGGADGLHGELLSDVLFADELIEPGRADAERWSDEHPADLWQLDPLPHRPIAAGSAPRQ